MARIFGLFLLCLAICANTVGAVEDDDSNKPVPAPTTTKPQQKTTDSDAELSVGAKTPAHAKPSARDKQDQDIPARVANPVDEPVEDEEIAKEPRKQQKRKQQKEEEPDAAKIDKIAETWFQRDIQLKRLAEDLTNGKIAARPIGIDYRLRPGDRVRLVTWGGSSLNEMVIIDANGSLAVPGFGTIPVSGRSQIEAQQLLVELVRSHFKLGGAALGVEQAGSVSVTVAGEVKNAGLHTLPPGASILDALSAAGGITAQGSLRSIAVSSPDGSSTTLDLFQLATAGKPEGVGSVANGTFVFVPLRGPEVQVFGSVRRSAAIELRTGESLAEAIGFAGGLAPDADSGVVRLAREGDAGQEMRQLALNDLSKETIRDGDRILVVRRSSFEQARKTLTIDGLVRSPGRYAWEDGLSVGRLITYAGGVLPEANLANALVRRQRNVPAMLDQGGGVGLPVIYEVIAPVALDTVLQPRDELVVPAYLLADENDMVVTVNGEVRQPGPQPLSPGLTVQQAILLAGGVTTNAQLDVADVVRLVLRNDGSRDVQRLSVDLYAVLGGASGLVLQARDQLVVRKRNDQLVTVMVKGEARNSGSFSLPHGTTIGQVMIIAGGLTPDAFVGGIRLFRGSEKEAGERFLEDLKAQVEGAVTVNRNRLNKAHSSDDVESLELTIANQEQGLIRLHKARATGRLTGIDFQGILEGRASADLELRDGDIIEIPTKPLAIRVLGEVMSPGSLRFERNLKVETVVQRSGGYSQEADHKRVFVVRADGSVVATAGGTGVEWDGQKHNWISTKLSSIVLREGDAVIVPPDLTYKPSWRVIAKDFTQILFQVAVSAATVIAVAP